MHKFAVLLFFVFSSAGYAQQTDQTIIRNIADSILTNGTAYEHLRVLCKTVGSRLAGSPQMYKAENWAVRTLQDAEADTVYLQQCMVPRWVRGGKDEASIYYKDIKGRSQNKTLEVLALGNSLGTGKAGLRAAVILIHNFEELDRRKSEVKGKIVFYNYPFNPTYIVQGRAYGEAGAYRRAGPSRAAQYGAVAVVTRSLSQSTDNLPHTGSTAYDEAFPKIPCAAIGLKDANFLSSLLKHGTPVQLSLRTMGHFLPDTIGHNVIGELKGSEFPDEYITVGGHLDSWDVGEGAHDDAAGCVQSIEVLSVLKKIGYKPKHTIRVVLFANEENGLRGGTTYAEVAKAKNEKHVFALESDAGGFTPRGFGFTMDRERLNRFKSHLPLLMPYGVCEFVDGGWADIGPLNRLLGVPIAGLTPDSQRYFDVHHARNDIFENVHKRELELGAVCMAALIFLVDRHGL